MPIRWNALQLSRAMDDVEDLVNRAQTFLDEARDKAMEATRIPNLPNYMLDHLTGFIYNLERTKTIKSAISRVRQHIPKDVLEKEEQKNAQLTLE